MMTREKPTLLAYIGVLNLPKGEWYEHIKKKWTRVLGNVGLL